MRKTLDGGPYILKKVIIDCVALWFKDPDQVIKKRIKRQLVKDTSNFINIDNKSLF